MQIAKLDTAEIAYLDEGKGMPILLVHGFASSANINWVEPGWVKTLTDAGYRAIVLDNRGHGASQKFYSETDYVLENMAADALALLDHLGIEGAHVMGYSMGARISAVMASMQGERLGKVILAGNGYNMIEGGFDSSDIHEGLAAESLEAITTKVGIEFRLFAEHTGSDLKALAACIMGGRSHIPKTLFEGIQNDVLVTVGTEDKIAINGEKLSSIIPTSRFVPIPKRNHMNAVGDKVYKQAVVEFLQS